MNGTYFSMSFLYSHFITMRELLTPSISYRSAKPNVAQNFSARTASRQVLGCKVSEGTEEAMARIVPFGRLYAIKMEACRRLSAPRSFHDAAHTLFAGLLRSLSTRERLQRV